MTEVPEDIKTVVLDILYGQKSENEKPISFMQSETLYHFTFNRTIGGKNMPTGCSYSKDSIIKILCQELKENKWKF